MAGVSVHPSKPLPSTYSLCIVAFAKALTSQVVSAVVVMEKASKQGRPLNFSLLRTDVFAREIVSGGGWRNF